jgi:cell division protein ZapA
MKKALDVEILGQKFTISSDAEEGYMLKVAGYVDGKMQELIQAAKPAAKANVAMLAALNIADEYHRLKDSHEAILQRLDILSKKLSTTLTEEGYMLKVAGYVDGKMQELIQAAKPAAKANVAMLAALNIADEYHRLKDSHEAILQRLDILSKKLSTTLTEEG